MKYSMPQGAWWIMKMKILQEWIENVTDKTEYFIIIRRYFIVNTREI